MFLVDLGWTLARIVKRLLLPVMFGGRSLRKGVKGVIKGVEMGKDMVMGKEKTKEECETFLI